MQLTGIAETDLSKNAFQIQKESSSFDIIYKDEKISLILSENASNPKFHLKRKMDHNSGVYYKIQKTTFTKFTKNGIGKKEYAVMNSFWSFVSEKLKKYRGIENKYLYLHLKEIETKFNLKKTGI